MDVVGGEELQHLAEDVLEEAEGALPPDADVRSVEGPLALAGQLGVGGRQFIAVPRELDLGHDGNAEAGGMGYDAADVVLGVGAAVGSGRALIDEAAVMLPPAVPVGDGAPGGLLRQQGILLRGEAPAAAIDQVPVEAVHLVARHLVQQLDDEVGGHEVARYVEHDPAPGEACRVRDGELRQAASVLPYQL